LRLRFVQFLFVLPAVWFGALGVTEKFCAAGQHVDGFDEGKTRWTVSHDPAEVRVRVHQQNRAHYRTGGASEHIQLEPLAPQATARLEYAVPPSRLFDELKLTLWVWSNSEGGTLMVRVICPHQLDPQTGTPVAVLLKGDVYSEAGQWQKLECSDLDRQFKSIRPQLRKQLLEGAPPGTDIEWRDAYVDGIALKVPLARQPIDVCLDDLEFGPIVEAGTQLKIVQAAQVENDPAPEAEFRLDRLFVRGRPFFPRIVPYHGERLGELSRMRANTVWIPDYQDTALLADLQQNGLFATASPPRIAGAADEPPEQASSHLAPFGADTAPVLFWYLGTRIPPDAKRELLAWEEQIRNADRRYRRPLMGDVSGLERTYSRHLSMLGSSRPPLQSGLGMKAYRDWLIERHHLAQPGTFLWTWVQTEPTPALQESRTAAGFAPIVVEPEQIRLQVYAALAAGCRGVGFWTHSPFDADQPGALERKLMIAQLNMELELIEPWLATGTVSEQAPFSVQLPPGARMGQLFATSSPGGRAEQEARLNNRDLQNRKRGQVSRELEAAVLLTQHGKLVLPVWYGEESPFVPGQMSGNDAKILVPGGGESARAWEISTTEIRSLDKERVAGGTQVTLRKFDTTAIILFTEDGDLIERLRQRMREFQEPSARVSFELARAKLQRVGEVDLKLHGLGYGERDAARILARASALVDQAEELWKAQRYHDSRLDSADAMQLLRILQQVYWNAAVRKLHAPVSSPHTLCFQTLPDHWEMVARVGRSEYASRQNLLPSGDFEDPDTVIAAGWKHEQNSVEGIRAAAELYPRPHGGKYCLRLIAAPASGQDAPRIVTDRPVTVTSPRVDVHKGQLVIIKGWVRLAAPSLGTTDGVLLYDSLGGQSGALRWRTPFPWQQFSLIREVHESTALTLTMTLTGLGEVHFDDLEVIVVDGSDVISPSDAANPRPEQRPGPLNFLRGLPGLRGKPAGN
jgi:hypothetical protein